MSPKLVRRLNIPANLDGNFLINVNFCNRDQTAFHDQDSEAALIQSLQKDLDELGISKIKNNYGAKWKAKKNQNESDELKAVKNQMGAEQIISLLSKTPLSLMKELTFVKNKRNETIDLLNLVSVECTSESLLLYGRYIKHSREVSQTPWLLGDREIVRNIFC